MSKEEEKVKDESEETIEKKDLNEISKEEEKQKKEEKKKEKSKSKTKKNDRILELEEENGKLREKYQKLNADFLNKEKHLKEDSLKAKSNGKMQVFESLIPSLNNYESAMGMIQDENTKKGIEMILNGFLSALEQEGLTEINCTGKLDVAYHEAIETVSNDELENEEIVEVKQKGYMYEEKVITHAKVVVNKI